MSRRKQSPWKRGRDEVIQNYRTKEVKINTFDEKFNDLKYVNMDIDLATKRAALKVSPSVVGLISRHRTGGEILFKASGTIYESGVNTEGLYLSSIMTSASLIVQSSHKEDVDVKIEVYTTDKMYEGSIVGYDVHYNIAIINILSDEVLAVATMRHLDDSISLDPTLVYRDEEKFRLHPHSSAFKIWPGERVIALGRHCGSEKCDLMIAPGSFSANECKYACMELLKTSCIITKCGIGGPLVNRLGEVIGLNFMNEDFTPFLAVNIVHKILTHFKMYDKFCRPWIGLKSAANLYTADPEELEDIILPNLEISGVLVELVVEHSPAAFAGLQFGDVIVESNGKPIKGFLQFCCKMLDEAGSSVELGVIRTGIKGILKIMIDVEEISPERFNSWPLPEEYTTWIKRYRLPE